MKPKKLEIGDTVKWINEKRHIVAFLNDNDESLVVFKVWYPSRGWKYGCDYLKLFLYNICLQEDYNKTKRNKLFELNDLTYGDIWK